MCSSKASDPRLLSAPRTNYSTIDVLTVSKVIAQLLSDSLSWVPVEHTPAPKLRLTFLICSLGFTSLMLFDDNKQCYHLMLQQFMHVGGMKSFFQLVVII